MGQFFVSPEDVETQVFEWGLIKWMSAPSVLGAQSSALEWYCWLQGKAT